MQPLATTAFPHYSPENHVISPFPSPSLRRKIMTCLPIMSLIVSVLSVSERKNHAEGNIYQDKREAVLYRGQLWSATYDSNREVTNVFIPYTVKLGGWFSGLGKYKAPPRLTNFPSPLDLSRGVGGAGGSSVPLS